MTTNNEELEELKKRIAETDPAVVRREHPFAQEIYNRCRRELGLPEVKFEK
jgi:hypothetical protein